MKKLVQSDFDGTLTWEDVSFQILDAFTTEDWRHLLKEYQEGKRSVLSFTREAFAMVKEDEETILEFVEKNARIRDGLKELVDYCLNKGFEFVIVSNGLDLYINFLLKKLGLEHIPVYAAKTRCAREGMQVSYIGPDGSELSDGFKAAHLKSFLKRGYEVAYIGDGLSDIQPVKLASLIFARGALLQYCKGANLTHYPFESLKDVIKGLERWHT